MVQKRLVFMETRWGCMVAGSPATVGASGSCLLTPQFRSKEVNLIKACSVTRALQPGPAIQSFHNLSEQCHKVGTLGLKS